MVGPKCCYCHSINLAVMEQFLLVLDKYGDYLHYIYALNLHLWCVRKLKKDQIRSGSWLLLSSLKELWNRMNENLGLAWKVLSVTTWGIIKDPHYKVVVNMVKTCTVVWALRLISYTHIWSISDRWRVGFC